MDIPSNVGRLRQHIDDLATQYGRQMADIHLIAVTKTQDAAVLPQLAALGITDFGENRLDHLASMQIDADPSWQFHGIGRVQSRQLPQWAAHCDSLHSLHDRKHVERLANACAKQGKQLPIFIQVNTSAEAAKAGLEPDQLEPMLVACRQHPDQLAVQGLMCMAPVREADGSSDSLIRKSFADLRVLAEQYGLKRLSMGMSGDYDLAIAEGATDIRVGSMLFQ